MAKSTIILVDPCSSRLMFIDEVRKAGYEPVCVFPFHSYNETYESMQYKNEVSNIKALCREKTEVIEASENLDETIQILRNFNVTGVINCSDSATHVSDVIAEKLGCPNNPPESSDVRMDKADMQQRIAEKGLRCIKTAIVSTENDIRKFWTENNISCAIVKPSRSGGMKGVNLCYSIGDALVALFSLQNANNTLGEKNNKVIIQEFIQGTHYFTNTVSVNGRHKIAQAWIVDVAIEEDIFSVKYVSIPIYPTGYRNITKYVFEALDALEFRNGIAQTEVLVDNNGPVLMEVNPRMMKFYVTPEMQDKVFGNHNSDIAIMALAHPETFLGEWEASGNLKPFIIKRVTSFEEGPRYVKPAEVLFNCIDTVVEIEMNVPTDSMIDMKRTTDVLHFPCSVQLFNENPIKLTEVSLNLNIIERRYPDLLWDKTEIHESSGFLSDISEVTDEIGGKTVAILNDASILEWKDGKYGSADSDKIYSCGVIVLGGKYKLDERYKALYDFYKMIKEGGRVYALKSSYENMPYKETGMEAILNLFGAEILMPKAGNDDIIECIVHH